MTDQPHSPIDVDPHQINELIEEAVNILGKKWFERRLKKDKLERDAAQKRDHSRHRVRYSPNYPIIQWYVEYIAWRDSFSKTGETSLHQTTILLTTFANNLAKTKNLPGIEHILPRLRTPDDFMATAFEVEVATSYVNRNWQVEFIETGTNRSPDLKVTSDNGNVFWVECKCRDQMSGRDALISNFWEQLQDKLYRHWSPAKSNFGLMLKSENDPIQLELQPLADALIHTSNILLNHPQRKQAVLRGVSPDKKYEFTLHYLADPDEKIPPPTFNDMGVDRFTIECDVSSRKDGVAIFQNPKFFSFTNKNPPDKYSGVLNAFNSAVGQLPESGPGVI